LDFAIVGLRIQQLVIVEDALLCGGRDRLVIPTPISGQVNRLAARSLRQILQAANPFDHCLRTQAAPIQFTRPHELGQLAYLAQLRAIDWQFL
jgi:hypothetical protein